MVLSAGALLGLMLWLQVARRVRPELTPLVACSIALLFLYGAGLTGWLGGGLLALQGICLALAVSSIPRFRTLTTAEWHAICAVNAVFLALAVAAWFTLHDGRFHTWDEFSHWGRVSKSISVEGALPTSSTGVLLLDYPPGAALFHYFVLGGTFSEGGTYVAQSLFLAAAALAVTPWRGVRRLHLFAGTLAGVGLMLLILGSGFDTVEVDHLLGAVFGAAVSAYVLGDSRDSRTAAALIPVLCALTLFKPVGLVFAMASAAVIGVGRLAGLVGRRAKGVASARWGWLALTLAIFAAPIAVHQFWQAHLTGHGFQKTFNLQWSVDRLSVLVNPSRRSDLQPTTVRNYFRAVDRAPVGRFGNGIIDSGRWVGSAVQVGNVTAPVSARQWFWALLVASVIVVFLQSELEWRTHLIAHACLAGGCLIYLALLLYTYLYGFGAYEGPRVISFGRYAGSWFLGWMLVILASLGNVSLQPRWREAAAGLMLLSVLVWAVFRVREQPRSAILQARSGVLSIARIVEQSLPPGAKTYVIWQATTGLEFHLMAYELSPRRTNPWCWTLGEKFVDGDVWTCPLSPQEWSSRLAEYEFVLVAHADKQFWTRYGPLFAAQSSDGLHPAILFKVERLGGEVVLQPVQ